MRASWLLSAALLVQGCGFAWTSKYPPETQKETEESMVWHRQVELKESGGNVKRLGYLRKFKVKPAGYRPGRYPSLPETTEMYRVYDDNLEIIGRIDWEGDTYLWVKEHGDYIEKYLGKHEFFNALRVIYGLSAKANIYIAGIDPYRGG